MELKRSGGTHIYRLRGLAVLFATALSTTLHGAPLLAYEVDIDNDISVSASTGGNTVSGTVHAGQSSAEASVRSTVNGVVVEDFHERVESASGSPAVLTHEQSSTTVGAHIETSVRLEASAGTSTPNVGTSPIRGAAHVQKKPSVTVSPPSPNPKNAPHDPKVLSSTSTSVQQRADVAQSSKPAREVRTRGRERNFILAHIINAIDYVRTIFRR